MDAKADSSSIFDEFDTLLDTQFTNDDIKETIVIAPGAENEMVCEIEKKIEEASGRIVEGAPISKALITAEFLPKMVTGMISVAEASDTLDSMLIKISDLYQNEIDRSLLSLTKMIEPVLIVVMGGLIGLIVLSIMLPIIDLNLSIQ